MELLVRDFNGADDHFGSGTPADDWAELQQTCAALPLFLQPSDQKGKVGTPIFDPKATNAFLTAEAKKLGWITVPVPERLTMFGNDWDAGKRTTLAEWQFSNYPFLWNNVIRSETVFKGSVKLHGVGKIDGLVVVTKVGALPASNSTLYFEQAVAQLDAVMGSGTFDIPIRLVGLTIPAGVQTHSAVWTQYPGRYARAGGTARETDVGIVRRSAGKYGVVPMSFVVSD